MGKTFTVLVIVPPAGGKSLAVRRAAEIARATGGELHLCIFAYEEVIALSVSRVNAEIARRARHDFLNDQMQQLEQLVTESIDHPGVTEIDVVWSPVEHEAVICKALEIGADMVVKDVIPDSGQHRAVYTPLDWKLMRLLPCNLLLRKHTLRPEPERILAAIDVQAEARGAKGLNTRVFDASMRYAEYFNAQVDVVSVVPYQPLHGSLMLYCAEAYMQAQNKHLEDYGNFMDQHQVPLERRHRMTGTPSQALARFVSENEIDTVVLGSVYHGGLSRLLLGSTAESLVQEIDTDILVVKPDGFQEVLERHIDMAAIQRRHTALQEEFSGTSAAGAGR